MMQGPLEGYIRMLHHVLTSTGQALDLQGSASLGSFVLESLHDSASRSCTVRAQQLVNDLVRGLLQSKFMLKQISTRTTIHFV